MINDSNASFNPIIKVKISSLETECLSLVSKCVLVKASRRCYDVCVLLGSSPPSASCFPDSARRMKVERSPPVRGSLAEQVVLPCHFSILPPPTGTSSTPTAAAAAPVSRSNPDQLRIKWTKLEGDEESIVMVAQNGFIKIGQGFKDRVSVPSLPEKQGDASLTVTRLRASDAGVYRCEVMHGIEDTQDTVSLDVTGQ